MERWAEWCSEFSPLVGIEQSPEPESLLLDITGLDHLFGGEQVLAEKVVKAFVERGRCVRAAVADTLGAAWAMAHFEATGDRGEGIEHKRQGSLVVIRPGETLAALRPLPIEALRLPPETVDLLQELGVRQIEQLEALPRKDLSSRFGTQLLARWDQAMGRLAEAFPLHVAAPRFQTAWLPEHPTVRRETLGAALEHLVKQLVVLLRRESRGAMRVECRLDCVGAETLCLAVGLFQPAAEAKHLLGLLEVQLERLRLVAPVQAIRLTAAVTAPLERPQQELFVSDRSERQPARLASLVDRLSNRLGPQAVLRARLVSDAQPELACRYVPLVVGARRRTGSNRAAEALLLPRPTRLLIQPAPLQGGSALLSPSRPDRSRPLQTLRLGESVFEVAYRWGPERIETGWWRGRSVSRDYYGIETTDGRRLWIFCRLNDGQWFMHGTFD